MSDKMTEAGRSVSVNRCIMESSITIPGLNLLITPKEQHGPCSSLNIAFAIADATGFLERKPEHGRVLVFSLEDTKKRAEHMPGQYSAMPGDITVIYAYQPGTFGNRIEEGLDMFLNDNPIIKMVVIDSLEKIVEGMLADIADTVLKIITEGGNQDGHKYTLHVNRKDTHGNRITAEFDAGNCTWNQIVDK